MIYISGRLGGSFKARLPPTEWNASAIAIPYAGNPRHNDRAVDAVARSIEEFGFRQPIVVTEERVIIVGHTRWKAALKLGLKTAITVNWDELLGPPDDDDCPIERRIAQENHAAPNLEVLEAGCGTAA